MNKVKIEIKNRWTGDVMYEYEKENNTLRDTLEKAVKEGANLVGADLRGGNFRGGNFGGTNFRGADFEGANFRGANFKGGNFRGANFEGANFEGAYFEGGHFGGANFKGGNFRGAYLFMWDDNEPNISEIIEKIENNSSLRIKSYYINKHVLSPVSLVYWKNGLIIDDYEIIEPKKEIKKMTLSEVCEQLGYDIEIVKEH